MKCSLAEKNIYFKYIFHYNCNLVITTSQISHYNFTNLLCGSINRRICGLDFCYTSCDECVAKVIFTCRCGGRNMGRKGGWSEGAELSERGGASSGQSHSHARLNRMTASAHIRFYKLSHFAIYLHIKVRISLPQLHLF